MQQQQLGFNEQAYYSLPEVQLLCGICTPLATACTYWLQLKTQNCGQACHCEDNMYKFRLALKLIAHDGNRMHILVATEDSKHCWCSCCCPWPLQA